MSGRLPEPREDRPGQPVFVLDEPPEPAGRGCAATIDDLQRHPRARSRTKELGVDLLARDARQLPLADARRSRRDARGSGSRTCDPVKAEASAWTPSAVQLQQVWVDPEAHRQGFATRALRDLCRLLLERTPAVCLFVRPENREAIGSTRSSACATRWTTALWSSDLPLPLEALAGLAELLLVWDRAASVVVESIRWSPATFVLLLASAWWVKWPLFAAIAAAGDRHSAACRARRSQRSARLQPPASS